MCGIIGIVGKSPVAGRLLEGLKRLEYRGYDSAGMATVHQGKIKRQRAQGKLVNLEKEAEANPIPGNTGIAHTRWATHGRPTERNAHPHVTHDIAVVHNGIIENYLEIRRELEKHGHRFESDTDTEVIPQLISHFRQQGQPPIEAIQAAISRLRGAFALGIIFADHENLLIAARQGSPLAIGFGDSESYIGSDALALASLTSRIAYLEDGDIAVATREGVNVQDQHGKPVTRPVITGISSYLTAIKGPYQHFMLKEIHEQPGVIADSLSAYCDIATGDFRFPIPDTILERLNKIRIIACGTSYYAGMVAKYWIERLARIPVEVDIASEFRYRESPMLERELTFCISQSGETADTLAGMCYAKSQGQKIAAVVNVAESTMAREADYVLPLYAGPEIGVASTKAFTAQLAVLACLAVKLAATRGNLPEKGPYIEALFHLPALIRQVLQQDSEILKCAEFLAQARSILYIGRGTAYPIALEGALKLKELSYIHAEATAAGELKHGPIALVDSSVPIVAVAPDDALFDKTASNIEEIAARGGKVLLITSSAKKQALQHIHPQVISLPETHPFTAPILYTIPVQLLAYHVAALKGTDVDQPRNLAKSVTVE